VYEDVLGEDAKVAPAAEELMSKFKADLQADNKMFLEAVAESNRKAQADMQQALINSLRDLTRPVTNSSNSAAHHNPYMAAPVPEPPSRIIECDGSMWSPGMHQ
jgi:hypothetical protein